MKLKKFYKKAAAELADQGLKDRPVLFTRDTVSGTLLPVHRLQMQN